MEKVQKAKRNIYVQRAWDRRTDNKIKKICREEGEATAKEVLSILYKNLNGNIKTTPCTIYQWNTKKYFC